MNKTQSLIHAVAGLIFYSPDPERLTAFYRDRLGVPLVAAEHGTVGMHQEGMLGRTHIAIWDARQGHGAAPLIPVFLVDDLDGGQQAALDGGARRLHKPIDLGEGKRVVTFVDPDERAFRLIDLGKNVGR